MKRGFGRSWALILAGAVACAAWVAYGNVYVRRRFFAVAPIAQTARSHSQFLAVLMPRVSVRGGRYALTPEGLEEFLGRLKQAGYSFIGLDDVARMYSERRELPAKAVLIAFSQEDPRGVEAIDGVMRRLRLRGTIFLSGIADSGNLDQRRFLTRHSVAQMRASGAWDFGFSGAQRPKAVAAAAVPRAVFYSADASREAAGEEGIGLVFLGSEWGFNDAGGFPANLNMLTLRPERGAVRNFSIVERSWPRAEQFVGDFRTGEPQSDWVVGWGVAAMREGRLALLPTPRQTGAGVFLRGTEGWRDQVLEFVLRRARKEFWAYARYGVDGRFVRLGVRDGYWLVEQKTDGKALPTLLARAPIGKDAFPARIRLVLKGGSAIVHINGRLQFGRRLRLDMGVARGRVLLGVYSANSHSALAVLGSFKAAPLPEEWVGLERGGARSFDESALDGLRERAVRARVISPPWVTVTAAGDLEAAPAQSGLLRALAGFYGCQLVPMVDMPRFGAGVFADGARAGRLAEDLAGVAGVLDAAGLNLRFSGPGSEADSANDFLARLRAALNARGRGLWVTFDGSGTADMTVMDAVDGVLLRSASTVPGFEVLEPAGGASWSPSDPVLTASRSRGATL